MGAPIMGARARAGGHRAQGWAGAWGRASSPGLPEGRLHSFLTGLWGTRGICGRRPQEAQRGRAEAGQGRKGSQKESVPGGSVLWAPESQHPWAPGGPAERPAAKLWVARGGGGAATSQLCAPPSQAGEHPQEGT